MEPRTRIGIVAVGVALVLASLAPAAAETLELADTRAGTFAGPAFRITDADAPSTSEVPVAAYNSRDDQYLIVWSDYRRGAFRGNDIYGQLMNGDGTLVGTNFRISGYLAKGPDYPTAVAYNSISNQYLVVWQDERDGGYNIYGRRVKANGAMAGGEFLISGDVASAPAVAHNPATNQYLVVWTDYRGDPAARGTDIYGQRVRAGGRLAGGDIRISGDAATGNEYGPEVVCNTANGQYFVVWQDTRLGPTQSNYDVFGRRIRGGGRLAGDDFAINEVSATADGVSPAVAYNSTRDQYMVVWQDNRNYMTTSHDIYGRRVRAGGRLAGGDIRISGNPSNGEWEHKPVVAYDSTTDRYLVAWEDYRDYGTRRDEIYARRLRGGGKPVGGDIRIVGYAALADDNDPSVTYNPATHEFLVVWVDARDGSTHDTADIYGRRVNG